GTRPRDAPERQISSRQRRCCRARRRTRSSRSRYAWIAATALTTEDQSAQATSETFRAFPTAYAVALAASWRRYGRGSRCGRRRRRKLVHQIGHERVHLVLDGLRVMRGRAPALRFRSLECRREDGFDFGEAGAIDRLALPFRSDVALDLADDL